MELGISGQALASVNTLEEIMQILRKFNVDNIELWGQNVPFCVGEIGNEDGYIGKDSDFVLTLLNKYNITPACVTFGGAFSQQYFDNDTYADELVAAVKFAAAIGAKRVNHYCFHISMNEIDFDRLEKYMRPALLEAEKLGIIMVLENEAHDSTFTPENMLKVLTYMNSPNFKTNFDATNYYHAGVEGFPYAYDTLKKFIGYVHIKNGCIYNDAVHAGLDGKGAPMSGILTGKDYFYPTIGEGAVNMTGLLNRLRAEGYDGFITLEPHVSPASVESYYEKEIKFLRDNKLV